VTALSFEAAARVNPPRVMEKENIIPLRDPIIAVNAPSCSEIQSPAPQKIVSRYSENKITTQYTVQYYLYYGVSKRDLGTLLPARLPNILGRQVVCKRLEAPLFWGPLSPYGMKSCAIWTEGQPWSRARVGR
jgi:hypothetical protein